MERCCDHCHVRDLWRYGSMRGASTNSLSPKTHMALNGACDDITSSACAPPQGGNRQWSRQICPLRLPIHRQHETKVGFKRTTHLI